MLLCRYMNMNMRSSIRSGCLFNLCGKGLTIFFGASTEILLTKSKSYVGSGLNARLCAALRANHLGPRRKCAHFAIPRNMSFRNMCRLTTWAGVVGVRRCTNAGNLFLLLSSRNSLHKYSRNRAIKLKKIWFAT